MEEQKRFKSCYGMRFRKAAEMLTRYYDNVLKDHDLSLKQFSMLECIDAMGECNKSELASYTEQDRAAVIRTLEILKKKNLVSEADAGLRGEKKVTLTSHGMTLMRAAYKDWKKAQSYIEDAVGTENIDAMASIFDSLQKLDLR